MANGVRITSPAFRPEWADRLLTDARPFTPEGHFLYPADDRGNHLKGFFALEPVVRHPEFIGWIRDDVVAWSEEESIDVDVVFAPASAAVRALADPIARALRVPAAYWEYLDSGRFGDRLVDGDVSRGSKVLTYNGVSLTGNCVGYRLPQFVERLGGHVTAAAVFTKGTAPRVRDTETRFGARFHSALQVDVPIYAPAECPMCKEGPPVDWREFAEGRWP